MHENINKTLYFHIKIIACQQKKKRKKKRRLSELITFSNTSLLLCFMYFMLIVNLTRFCLRYARNNNKKKSSISFKIFHQALHIWVIVTPYFNFFYIISMSFFILNDVSFASWLWNFYFIFIFLYFHKIHTFLSTKKSRLCGKL